MPTCSQPPAAQTRNHRTNTHIRQMHLCTRGEGIWTRRIPKDPRLTEMAAVHLPPFRQTGVAAVRPLHQQPGASPVIEVDDNKAVLVITPALVYDMKGEVYVCIARGHRPSRRRLQGTGRLQEGGLPRAVVLCTRQESTSSRWRRRTTNPSTSAWRTPHAAKTRRRFPAKRATAAT